LKTRYERCVFIGFHGTVRGSTGTGCPFLAVKRNSPLRHRDTKTDEPSGFVIPSEVSAPFSSAPQHSRRADAQSNDLRSVAQEGTQAVHPCWRPQVLRRAKALLRMTIRSGTKWRGQQREPKTVCHPERSEGPAVRPQRKTLPVNHPTRKPSRNRSSPRAAPALPRAQ
jgi:hypothetical protein